jgi:hypothetical protein
MGINFTDFSRAPIQDSPLKTIFEDAFKGYQMGRAPAKMDEEQKQRQLQNRLKELEVEHKPKQFELDDKGKSLANSIKELAYKHMPEDYRQKSELNEARINKARKPQELNSALAQAFKLRSQFEPGTKDYKDVSNYIQKLGTVGGNNGIQVSSTPEGGFQVSIGGDSKDVGYIPGVGKLKPGDTIVNDKDGKTIGVNTRLSDADIKQKKAINSFNNVYPFLNSSLSAFSGKGSWKKFEDAVRTYNIDPKSKELVDNYFAAKQLLAVGTTKENARIGGNSTNQQLKMLRKTLDSSEVPERLKDLAGYQLPEGYKESSGQIFQDYLNSMDKAAQEDIPLWQFRSINQGGEKDKSLSNALATSNKTEDQEAAKRHYLSLSPEERKAYRQQHLGGK